ncbi:hypothetical protein MBLNU13_g04890t1 [Cladosporium sp. NU13]
MPQARRSSSIVNTAGQVVYDTFVYYPAHVPPRPPPQHLKLGVKDEDIRPENGAQPHAEMLDGIDFPNYVVHDTQRMYGASLGRLPGLSALSSSVLGRSIQVEEHLSVEDASATMELFLWHRERYESGCDYTGKALDSDINPTQVETGGRRDSLASERGMTRLTNVDGSCFQQQRARDRLSSRSPRCQGSGNGPCRVGCL